MLKRFKLKNYKNFKEEIVIDFGNVAGYQFSVDCISDGLITKIACLWKKCDRENKFRKSNYGYRFYNVCRSEICRKWSVS